MTLCHDIIVRAILKVGTWVTVGGFPGYVITNFFPKVHDVTFFSEPPPYLHLHITKLPPEEHYAIDASQRAIHKLCNANLDIRSPHSLP